MQLDTIFGTGGFRTVHLGEVVSLGGDGGVGQFCSAVFVLEVLTADRAVVVLFFAGFGTGGSLAGYQGKVVADSRDLGLRYQHIHTDGAVLAFGETGFRAGSFLAAVNSFCMGTAGCTGFQPCNISAVGSPLPLRPGGISPGIVGSKGRVKHVVTAHSVPFKEYGGQPGTTTESPARK